MRRIVLLSGGLDSGTALALVADDDPTATVCLFFDYGQPAVAREREAARALCDRFGALWQEVALPWLAECSRVAGSALAPDGVPPVIDEPGRLGDEESASAVWVPARNLVFLSIAAAHAEAIGAAELVVGFNREEAATFPDNRLEFLDAMDHVLSFACRSAPRVRAPVVELDKVGIARRAAALGLGPQDFWSCYRDRERSVDCRCESCRRSERAWAEVLRPRA